MGFAFKLINNMVLLQVLIRVTLEAFCKIVLQYGHKDLWAFINQQLMLMFALTNKSNIMRGI